MNQDLTRVLRWLRRSRPPRADLAKALIAGSVASLTSTAMLAGAVALLVESATRPGLAAVLGVLIVIELFAFLRSPLRFAERMSAHRLGFDAVSRWRRWLVVTIGALDFRQWRRFAAGDLLERSLHDTDELQDLWLRGVLPITTSLVVMASADVVILLLPAHGSWWPFGLSLLAVQLLAVGALALMSPGLLARDRALRRARGDYRGHLVELSAVTPDLVLLGHAEVADRRSRASVDALHHAEASLRGAQRVCDSIPYLVGVAALAALALRPTSSPVWLVVAAMIGVANVELVAIMRASIDTTIKVSAGAERLEELDLGEARGRAPWPQDTSLHLEGVTIVEGDETLVEDVTMTVDPGQRVAITGASGVGKSTLLRALAGLDEVQAGTVSIGATALRDIDETELRRHVGLVASEPGLTRGFALDVMTLGRSTSGAAFAELAQLGIDADASTRWDELSRGERARIAIVRTLVVRPRIVLLDEPTSGLGRDETLQVLELLAATGATVIAVTHDPLVAQWCDVQLVLDQRRLRRVSR